jgi:hypothetical protein
VNDVGDPHPGILQSADDRAGDLGSLPVRWCRLWRIINILSSPLLRALQTADAIAQVGGVTLTSTAVAQVLPDELRGNESGVLGLTQAVGDLGFTAIVSIFWAAISPGRRVRLRRRLDGRGPDQRNSPYVKA